MTLDYIYHSGFAIEAEGVTVIIDYYKDSSETEHNRGIVHDYLLQRPGKLYVLATHFHPDHFNREILTRGGYRRGDRRTRADHPSRPAGEHLVESEEFAGTRL